MPLLNQESPTLPDHLSTSVVFWVRVVQSVVFSVVFWVRVVQSVVFSVVFWVRVVQSVVFSVVLWRRLFVLSSIC
jgi:hypothetical protein